MENKEITFSEKVKKVILNKFYIEYIIYILILNLGFFIVSIARQSTSINNLLVIYGLINSLIISLVLYIFGYIISKKRKKLNKFFPSIAFIAVFEIMYFFITLVINSSVENDFTNYIGNIYSFIVCMHYYNYYWINSMFSIELPIVIYIIIPGIFVFLGSKRNYKKARKREIFEEERKKIEESLKN